jgi:hypothetical protein
MTIVTHTSPDWDAIGAVWLLRRSGLDITTVTFVNTASPDPAVLAAAVAVVDTGREYNEAELRFDHHQFEGDESTMHSAVFLVARWLLRNDALPQEIWPIIELIHAGDHGQSVCGWPVSRDLGIHALLSARKARRTSDAELLEWGCAVLDDLADNLIAREAGRQALQSDAVVYDSGTVVALKNANWHASRAAAERGAVLVLFQSETTTEDGISYAIGITRNGERTTPHVGALVERVIAQRPDLAPELTTWFRHPAGFFAGRGTAKAPVYEPITIDLADVAAAIDAAWRETQ